MPDYTRRFPLILPTLLTMYFGRSHGKISTYLRREHKEVPVPVKRKVFLFFFFLFKVIMENIVLSVILTKISLEGTVMILFFFVENIQGFISIQQWL